MLQNRFADLVDMVAKVLVREDATGVYYYHAFHRDSLLQFDRDVLVVLYNKTYNPKKIIEVVTVLLDADPRGTNAETLVDRSYARLTAQQTHKLDKALRIQSNDIGDDIIFAFTEVGFPHDTDVTDEKEVRDFIECLQTYLREEAILNAEGDHSRNTLRGIDPNEAIVLSRTIPAADVASLHRDDIQLTLSRRAYDHRGLPIPNQKLNLLEVSGFVDLRWAPSVAEGDSLRQYIPEFVIDDISAHSENFSTLALGLLSAFGLSEQSLWKRAFEAAKYQSGKTHDLGVLVHLSTDPSQSTTIDDICYPGLVFSLDVPSRAVGTLHWQILAAATSISFAADELRRRFNDFTDGRLLPLLGNQPIVLPDPETILTGYYTGLDGQKHDVKDIDFLAVLNAHVEQNNDLLTRWIESINNTRLSLTQRLEQRMDVISEIVPNVVFTGVEYRVTFTAAFVQAFKTAAVNAGLEIVLPMIETENAVVRSGYHRNQAAIVPTTASGLFLY